MNTPIPGFSKLGPNYLSELPQVGSTEQWDIINMTMDAHPIHLHLVQFQLVNRQDYNLGVNFDTDEVDPNGYRALYDSLFPGGTFVPFYGPPLAYNTPNTGQALGGNPDVTPFLQGVAEKPQPWEVGWKDTFKMMPGQVTRIVVRFAPQDVNIQAAKPGKNSFKFDPTTGPGYVWHCHIVDHEDNEMMRPYIPTKKSTNTL
jgi:spore coat protein A, manganese oxidase